MTNLEQRARDALNVPMWLNWPDLDEDATRKRNRHVEAMCRQIEAHDATKAEFSEAVRVAFVTGLWADLSRFILPEPVKSLSEQLDHVLATGTADEMADWLGENAPAIHTALTALGGDDAD